MPQSPVCPPRLKAWTRRYFTDPRARNAYLHRIARRTTKGPR